MCCNEYRVIKQRMVLSSDSNNRTGKEGLLRECQIKQQSLHPLTKNFKCYSSRPKNILKEFLCEAKLKILDDRNI